ncbi:protein abrupt-like isoform X2 [Tigriopus californicus]|uniref:protein abrupt-like isoform X2 n=1 Tax=Tigriopus californicus TaxID=6832 RepID=UPI0027D9EE33|nr:protein abrupt-like isoform X2 [Tigriopus californicus]
MASSPQMMLIESTEEGATSSTLEHYSLRWNDYPQTVVATFRNLKEEEDFVDVTLACNSKQFTAHKVVLSACSPYFRQLLKTNPCQHPIIILRDIEEEDLKSLLKFMYNGEVRIPEDRMKDFLRTAETLQIRGLTDGGVTREPCAKNPNSSRVQADMNGAPMSPDHFGPSAAKRHRFNGPDSRNSPSSSPKSLGDWGRRSLEPKSEEPELDNNNSTPKTESLLSQALEKHSGVSSMYDRSFRDNGDGRDGDSASDTTSDRPESLMDGLIKSSVAESELHRQLSAGSPASMGNPLFPPGLEALYRQAGFPSAFLGLAASASVSGAGSPSGPVTSIPGMPSSAPQVGLQSHAVAGKLDMMRVRATDPRPCPKCGKIYRSAHTLRTHMEDKHTICPGYRCALCGTVAKSRNSLHSHMSRQHRGISTKDLPVLPMPSPFDPALASRLLAKAGVKVSPRDLAARASPTAPRRSDLPKLDSNLLQMQSHHFPLPPSLPTSGGMGRGSHDGNRDGVHEIEDLRVSSASSPFGSNGGPGYSHAHHMRMSQGMLNPKDFAALAAAGGAQPAGGMGSALLDTYLSMIAAAGGESNPMAAALNFQNPASRAAAFAAAAAAASGNQSHNGEGKDLDRRSASEDRDDMAGELGSDADNDDLSDNDDGANDSAASGRRSPNESSMDRDEATASSGPTSTSQNNHATTAASN